MRERYRREGIAEGINGHTEDKKGENKKKVKKGFYHASMNSNNDQ